MIVDVLVWIGQNILGQPVILLGIIALIGLVLQRKPVDEVVMGTAKVMIGVAMMIAGATLFVQELVNFQNLIYAAIGVSPKYPPGYIPLDKVIADYGSYAVTIMTIAFIIHLLIARFTKLKFVYLTGHLMWWVSLTVVATLLTINPKISPALLIGIGSIVMALLESATSLYTRGYEGCNGF